MRTGMIVALDPIETRLPITVSRQQLSFPVRGGAGRKGVVDEHHAMADEAVFSDRHQFADEGMRLHARARADHGALLDFGERADEAIVADPAFIEIAGLHHLHARAEFDVADAHLLDVGRRHETTPSRLSLGVKCSGTSSPVSIDS